MGNRAASNIFRGDPRKPHAIPRFGKTSRRRPELLPFTSRKISPVSRLATREAAMAAFGKNWRRE
jgi:hypothetical protein